MLRGRTALKSATITAANWFWLLAAAGAILGAAYLFNELGSLKDSTRFASELAEIRTFAMRVSLVAETVTQGNSPEYLEHELELAHVRSAALEGGILRLLGEDVGEANMRAVVISWDAVADAARQYAGGDLSAADLLTAAERATSDVDTLIDLVAARNEVIAERLKSLLKLGIILAMAGAATSAAGLTWAVRQLNESQGRELRSQARFRALVQNSSDAVVVLDTSNGTVSYASPSVQQIFGSGVLAEGSLFGAAVNGEDMARLRLALDSPRAATDGTVGFRIRHLDGHWRHVEASVSDLRADPLVEGAVLNIRDVTERTRLEEELQHQALHDTLTGLPNRALFCDRLSQALLRHSTVALRVAVLFIDLDDFKAVNDSLGHAAGDELLRSVAARLVEYAQAPSTVSRLAGDEFAILLEDCAPADAPGIARRLAAAITLPVTIEGRSFSISASVGVSVPRDANESAEALLREADIAMYAAKRRAPGSVTLFEPELHAAAIERSALEIDLRGAAGRGEFVLAFQPIVELTSGRTSGHEALVRWQHPTRGLLRPDDFIPLAEATGAIVELDA